MNDFKPHCPRCLSPDHLEYRLRIPVGCSVMYPSPYGPSFRHCTACGYKFGIQEAIELRLLEPVEPPSPAWSNQEIVS